MYAGQVTDRTRSCVEFVRESVGVRLHLQGPGAGRLGHAASPPSYVRGRERARSSTFVDVRRARMAAALAACSGVTGGAVARSSSTRWAMVGMLTGHRPRVPGAAESR